MTMVPGVVVVGFCGGGVVRGGARGWPQKEAWPMSRDLWPRLMTDID